MASTDITFRMKVHGGVTVQSYLENTLALHATGMGVESFTVERLEQSQLGGDNWYEALIRITPRGLHQNLDSVWSQLESRLAGDTNIIVLQRHVAP